MEMELEKSSLGNRYKFKLNMPERISLYEKNVILPSGYEGIVVDQLQDTVWVEHVLPHAYADKLYGKIVVRTILEEDEYVNFDEESVAATDEYDLYHSSILKPVWNIGIGFWENEYQVSDKVFWKNKTLLLPFALIQWGTIKIKK